MDRSFVVMVARFHRMEPNKYLVQGYFQGNSIAGSRMTVLADNTELPLEISSREGLAVRQKYIRLGLEGLCIDREYDLTITLPDEKEKFRQLRVFQERDGRKQCVYRTTASRLAKERKIPDGCVDSVTQSGQTVTITGWAVGNSPCRVQVVDGHNRKLKADVSWYYRQDVADIYPELEERDPEENCFAYSITLQKPENSKMSLIVASDRQKMVCPLKLGKTIPDAPTQRSLTVWEKGAAYLRRNGIRRTVIRVVEKTTGRMVQSEENYMAWQKRMQPSREELEAQQRNVFLVQPKISVLVPLYKTPEKLLREMVASVQMQTYRNWELCLSDGSGRDTELTGILEELKKEDERIRFVTSREPLGIADNTNAALSLAQGEYLTFLDHDDLLSPNALYECVRQINAHPETDMIYTDEDKISMKGKEYFQPHFKSDFNIDLLCSMNYFCHLVMVKRSLQQQIGIFDAAYDGAQDYDFVLRCVEKAEHICHIPKVLYHWRAHKDSTSENPESKRYAFEAGMRAVQAHYDRVGIAARVSMGAYPGLYRTDYEIPDPAPMISIIIPNKDHIEDLDKCIRSIQNRSEYPSYEFVIIENNSTEEETFEYYRQMISQFPNIHVVQWKDEFNFSLINNYGVTQAAGEYLLFLNNDTEMISADCLEQLLGPCLRDDVGITGARLYYPDNTIQHAGVIIGFGGIAGHAFIGLPRTANGYFSRIICQSDLSAVTAACMMVKRSVFEQAGGFDGALKIAFNDIDFCLKVRELGKLVVYNPFAELYHFESKSRGYEDTPEKVARFNREADEFLRRWPDILHNGDPYYNPNLSLDRADFALRRI